MAEYDMSDLCDELNDLMELSIPKIGIRNAVIMLCTFAEASLKKLKKIEEENAAS